MNNWGFYYHKGKEYPISMILSGHCSRTQGNWGNQIIQSMYLVGVLEATINQLKISVVLCISLHLAYWHKVFFLIFFGLQQRSSTCKLSFIGRDGVFGLIILILKNCIINCTINLKIILPYHCLLAKPSGVPVLLLSLCSRTQGTMCVSGIKLESLCLRQALSPLCYFSCSSTLCFRGIRNGCTVLFQIKDEPKHYSL